MGAPAGPGWRGVGFYMDNRQEAYDAELFAVTRGLHHLASRRESGEHYAVFAGSLSTVRRVQSDAPGPGQDMAEEIIDLAHTIYSQGNTITVR